MNFLLILLITLQFVNGNDDLTLPGTWSSKSNTVFTGPGFFDPVDELLIEPSLPGISYSFTEDGYFEQATYQVTSNPRNHSCPVAALTFQHGTYQIFDNGSLALNPFTVDGRQLVSQPCKDNVISTYNRYNQSVFFLKYDLSIDKYYGRYKLKLYEWDGTPVQPLYLAYKPPMMLPTITLNPTQSNDVNIETSSPNTNQKKRSLREKVRRSLENKDRTKAIKKSNLNYDFCWWGSIILLITGGFIYIIA